MNPTEHLTSSEFWESPEHFVSGGWEGNLPVLEGCGSSVIFRTSGSTGDGKWVVLEKSSLLLSARTVNCWLGVDKDSRWGLALPTDHVGGFAILARTYEAGCALSALRGKWDAEKFTRWIAEEAVTHTSLVPTQVHDLVDTGAVAPANLKAVVVGGGSLSDELGQAARKLGWPVLASYGMTEAASQIATQVVASLEKSFAEAPLEILPIWKCSVDENDLLSISGDALFKGTISAGKFIPRERGPFLTNDRVVLDGSTLVPLGRSDLLVKVMGVLVDIGSLEKRFLELAGGTIEEGSFVIIPLRDERKEHVLLGVFENGESSCCVGAFNRVSPGTERLDGFHVVGKFPRTSLGKIRRAKLAETVSRIARA